MKVLLVFIAVLVVVAATSDGYNQHKDESRTKTRSKTEGKHQPVYNHHKGESRTRTRSKTDGKHQPVTRPTTDGKHQPVYCPKPNPPVYGYIKENNAYYQIGSIIHYYCNYGYELYGLSWNKCVYEYGVAKWEYPVPICKPKAYSG
ncbi:hypothetical protein EMCRGX_G016250 [Ephydatia muelleri]